MIPQQGEKGNSLARTLSFWEFVDLFYDEKKAEDWFVESRWPDGVRCVYCKSERVGEKGNHLVMRFHCTDCHSFFSAKTNSVMHSSKLPYRVWARAIVLIMTYPKGISSYQMAADLGVTQKTAWYLGHRIRYALANESLEVFEGPVEVDETWIGGRARNQTMERKRRMRKIPVVGMRDQATGSIILEPIRAANKRILQDFVYAHTRWTSEVFTDEAAAYRGLARRHSTVNHSRGEYGLTNGIESVWALVKRGHMGVYHRMSEKHLPLYMMEFEGRHNFRSYDALEKMVMVVQGADSKRMRYVDLITGPQYT